jgi:hypothetical protein
MSELKFWMVEVEEPSEYSLTQFQQDGGALTGDTDDDDDMNENVFNNQMSSLNQTLGPLENTPNDIFANPTSFLEHQPFQAPWMPTNEPLPSFQGQISTAYTSYDNEGSMAATSDAYMTLGGNQGEYDDKIYGDGIERAINDF